MLSLPLLSAAMLTAALRDNAFPTCHSATTATIQRNAMANKVSMTMTVKYKDEDAQVFLDDSSSGELAGMQFECEECNVSLGYPDGFVPDTIKEADASPFVPFYTTPSGENYCLRDAPVKVTKEIRFS